MVRFINRLTGTVMWVHESRIDEYLAAGHTLAAPPKPEKKRPASKKASPK